MTRLGTDWISAPLVLVAALLGLAACSSGADDQQGSATSSTATSSTATPPVEASPDETITAEAEPVRPVPTQVSDETSHWVGVNSMSASAVDITWSEVEGDEVVYQLFRFETEVFENGSETKEAVDLDRPYAEVIGERSFVDEAVEPGTFYTYVLRIIADDAVLERRWTDVLAVDDTTPPARVEDVEFEVTAEGVLIEWSPSSDDVEFGSYGVFRTDGDGDARYIGGGGDIGQTSFLDDTVFGDGAPADGLARYEIVAFDFHNNRSAPAVIEVTLG